MIKNIKEYLGGESTDSWKHAVKGFFVLISIIGVACAVEWYVGWRSTHEYRMPVVFRSPIVTIKREVLSPLAVEQIKEKTEQEILDSYKLGPVLTSVRFLESTGGKNDSCKDDGLINGFGYRQSSFDWKCYDSFEEVVEVVNIWFENRLGENGNNIMEAVCFYNTGVPNQLTCEYGQNFMSVITERF